VTGSEKNKHSNYARGWNVCKQSSCMCVFEAAVLRVVNVDGEILLIMPSLTWNMRKGVLELDLDSFGVTGYLGHMHQNFTHSDSDIGVISQNPKM